MPGKTEKRTATATMIILARTKNSKRPGLLTEEEAWTLARECDRPEWRDFGLHRLISLASAGNRGLDEEIGAFLKELGADKRLSLGVLARYASCSRVPLRHWARQAEDAKRLSLGMEPRRQQRPQKKAA
ncbi:MAG TPA: hypothetical protein VFY28_03570 [Candidatus Paceibacterota bacterium]|nr:hypothetical protein [Candidatus Paceibacterota bacterium]